MTTSNQGLRRGAATETFQKKRASLRRVPGPATMPNGPGGVMQTAPAAPMGGMPPPPQKVM